MEKVGSSVKSCSEVLEDQMRHGHLCKRALEECLWGGGSTAQGRPG